MIHVLGAVNAANPWLQLLLAVLVTAYAFACGGPGVRGAAAVNAVGWIVGWIGNYLIQPVGLHLLITCTQDALVAAGFLYFAVRYNSLWLSVAVIAQGAQLGLDFISITEWNGFSPPVRFVWGVVLNGLTDVMQISLLGAAVADRRRMISTRTQSIPSEPTSFA